MNVPDRESSALTWADRFRWLIATCGGFGYCPLLPGTCGALWGVAIYVAFAVWTSEPWQTIGIATSLVLVCVATFRLSPWAERFFQEKDSGKFVTDEVAGFLTTVLLFRTPEHPGHGALGLSRDADRGHHQASAGAATGTPAGRLGRVGRRHFGFVVRRRTAARAAAGAAGLVPRLICDLRLCIENR